MYTIIGGGISGLYTAYALHKKYGIQNIVIIEKNNRLGGRINTLHIDDDTYLEMGAGGIYKTQLNILALISELGLDNLLTGSIAKRSIVMANSVSTSKYTAENNNIIPTIYQISGIININDTDFYDIIEDLTKRLDNNNFKKIAMLCNLYQLIEKIYGYEKADFMTYQFGYHSDFYDQNAVEALNMFKKDFVKNNTFYRIKGGMSQIISALEKYIKSNNIEIKLNCSCDNIARLGNQYHCLLNSGDKIITDNIVCALRKKDLLRINYFQNIYDKLDSILEKSLIRIYLFFPLINGKVWFDDIPNTITTRTMLNQIIPINKEKGILMVYCDSRNADSWNDFDQNNILKREVMFSLTKLFSNLIIPDPDNIYVSYYKVATHVWKQNVNPEVMYEDIVHPISNENIFIVGEAYSLNQQWCEGAIQSVNHLMTILEKNRNK